MGKVIVFSIYLEYLGRYMGKSTNIAILMSTLDPIKQEYWAGFLG